LSKIAASFVPVSSGIDSATVAGSSPHAPRSPGRPLLVRPCGIRRSIADRNAARLSGKSLAVSVVRCAIIPQPISTPTAAGTIAPLVGITLPTVAPMPQCTSGITATCRCTNGSDATFRNCCRALASTGTPAVHILIGIRWPSSTVYVLIFSRYLSHTTEFGRR
jgi:hypothetical protein